jgi:hypothetical protein
MDRWVKNMSLHADMRLLPPPSDIQLQHTITVRVCLTMCGNICIMIAVQLVYLYPNPHSTLHSNSIFNNNTLHLGISIFLVSFFMLIDVTCSSYLIAMCHQAMCLATFVAILQINIYSEVCVGEGIVINIHQYQ